MLTYLRTLLSMVVLVGCGSQQTLPVDPVINVSPTALLFRSDLNASFIVGVTPYGTDGLVITNGGQNPLTIHSVTLTGDSAFSLLMPAPAGDCDGGACQKLTIDRSPDSAAIELQFAPTAAKTYHGTLTITSDGTNDGGTVVVPVTAVGVVKDAG